MWGLRFFSSAPCSREEKLSTWVECLSFRVLGFGLSAFGFEFCVLGFGFRVSGFRFRVLGSECTVCVVSSSKPYQKKPEKPRGAQWAKNIS